MSAKDVHIVFQVLNFLHGEDSAQLNLLPNDKLILINLASHNGPQGICPSFSRIAKELKLSRRYVLKRIENLTKINLISAHQTMGLRNRYTLNFPKSSDLQITSCIKNTSDLQDTTSDLQITGVVIPRSLTSDLQITLYNKEQLNNNKDINTPPTPSDKNLPKEEIQIPDWLDKQDWEEFLQHRKSLKSPMSIQAQKRGLTDLKKLKDEGHSVSDVLNQSIVNGWKGFFPVRNNFHKDGKHGNKRKTHAQVFFDSVKGSLEGTKYDSKHYNEDGGRIIDVQKDDPFGKEVN